MAEHDILVSIDPAFGARIAADWLTGIARIRVTSGGNPNSFAVRFTDVYANKGGKWQMVTWQSTRTPD